MYARNLGKCLDVKIMKLRIVCILNKINTREKKNYSLLPSEKSHIIIYTPLFFTVIQCNYYLFIEISAFTSYASWDKFPFRSLRNTFIEVVEYDFTVELGDFIFYYSELNDGNTIVI